MDMLEFSKKIKMLLILVTLFVVIWVGISILKRNSSVEKNSTNGLFVKNHHYYSLIKLDNGRLFLFADRHVLQKKSSEINDILVFSSEDFGKNWTVFKKIPGMSCSDENSVIFFKNKFFLKVICDSANFYQTGKLNILSINIENKTTEISNSYCDMSKLCLYENNLVFTTKGKVHFLSDDFDVNKIMNTSYSGFTDYFVINGSLFAYCMYSDYILNITDNSSYKVPFQIIDVVACENEGIYFVYRGSDKKLYVANYSKDMKMKTTSKVDGYNFLTGIKCVNSVIVGIAKEDYNSVPGVVCSNDNGKSWTSTGIKGNVLSPYCIKDDSLFVLSLNYFSDAPIFNSLSLKNN